MKNFSIIAGIFALVIALSAAAAALVMTLWYWVMIPIFGLPAISFWQAWGLMILCGILFKSVAHITTTRRG